MEKNHVTLQDFMRALAQTSEKEAGKDTGKKKNTGVIELANFEELRKFFLVHANRVTGKNYVLDWKNGAAIDWILHYFYGLPFPGGVVENKPSHEKGILLYGSIGSGKTDMFRIIRAMKPEGKAFRFLTAHQLVAEYESGGYEALERYSKYSVYIDDLGVERLGRYYGATENVLQWFLMRRYEVWRYEGKIMHASTNATLDELREKYGERVFSRMWEMFNIVPFGVGKTARDFRRL